MHNGIAGWAEAVPCCVRMNVFQWDSGWLVPQRRMTSTRKSWLFPLFLVCFSLPGAAQPVPFQNGRQGELANPQEAWWFYRPERVETGRPEELLEVLGIKKGDMVAEILAQDQGCLGLHLPARGTDGEGFRGGCPAGHD